MVETSLAGRLVLITGANHGIGAATAVALAEQGARIALTFYRPPCVYTDEELRDAAQDGVGGDKLYHAQQQRDGADVVRQIQENGGEAITREADLSDPATIALVFDWCESEIGPVEVLVCNHTHCVLETFDAASVTRERPTVSLVSAAEIDRHFAINARANALLIAEYARRYLERAGTRGRIIAVSTDAASAHPVNVSYAASKYALESYCHSAAAELGKHGITVNIVAPGPIQTGYIPPDAAAKIGEKTPLGRVGTPEDVADVIVFLASDAARWLTGQVLFVGGGWKMPV